MPHRTTPASPTQPGPQPDLRDLSDTDLLVLWDAATERAEANDDWSEVARLEAEVARRGLA